jgi:serine/threonine-protein kinase
LLQQKPRGRAAVTTGHVFAVPAGERLGVSSAVESSMGHDGVLAALQHKLPQPGEVIADKYRVEGVIGVGGMGVVLSARHLQLGHSVAIKLLTSDDEERQIEAAARFLREAQAAAGLRSEHVVRIYDVGAIDEARPFMVMELLEGCDLSQLLERDGPLHLGAAVDLLIQACAAIDAAHQAGIVHRDLKPSNLFLTTRSDGTPWLKVLDFGISKSLSRGGDVPITLTSTRAVMGSPYYMSPEQIRDAKKVDERTDVWALGIILYELLTGSPAFQADTFPGVCAAIAADPPRPLRELRSDAPEALEAVIFRCLEKDPDRRLRSAAELAEALRPFSTRGTTDASGTFRVSLAPRTAGPAQPTGTSAGGAYEPTLSLDADGRDVARRMADSITARTQLSGAQRIATPDAPAAELPPPRSSARRWPIALVLLAVMGGAVALVDGLSSRERSAVSVAPSGARAFAFTIESVPSGAAVFERGRHVGDTPLRLRVTGESLREGPRSFVLSHPGYDPYTLDQGAAPADVHVRALLVRESTVARSGVAQPLASSDGKTVQVPRQRTLAPKRGPRASASTTVVEAPDIRLER